MREIKFRAWDDEEKKMYERVGVEPLRVVLFDHSKEYQMMAPEVIGYIGIDRDELFLEQYTGLKDKNGREIYEGDIVRVSHGDRHYWLYEMKCFGGQFGNNIYGECFEHNLSTDDSEQMYTFEKVKGRFYRSECLGGKWSEVIGNIHENPELLK